MEFAIDIANDYASVRPEFRPMDMEPQRLMVTEIKRQEVNVMGDREVSVELIEKMADELPEPTKPKRVDKED